MPRFLILFLFLCGLAAGAASAAENGPPSAAAPPSPQKQSPAEAQLKSAGCMSCHTTTDSLNMHTSPGVNLGCADCHGGNAAAFLPPGTPRGVPEYRRVQEAAHVAPRFPA